MGSAVIGLLVALDLSVFGVTSTLESSGRLFEEIFGSFTCRRFTKMPFKGLNALLPRVPGCFGYYETISSSIRDPQRPQA
eukprot:127507-Amorphochlora_amoeboformis.AAC.1